MKKMNFVFCSVMIFASACGSIHEEKRDANSTFQRSTQLPEGKVSAASIEGEWKTGCVVDTTKRTVYSITLSFQKDLLLSRTSNYADNTCTTPTLEEERLTRVTLDTSDETTSTMTESLLTYKYRALTDAENSALNVKEYCGYSTWATSKFRVFATAAECGLNEKELYKIQIYGDQELHLNPCLTSSSTDCKTLTFQRNTSGS